MQIFLQFGLYSCYVYIYKHFSDHFWLFYLTLESSLLFLKTCDILWFKRGAIHFLHMVHLKLRRHCYQATHRLPLCHWHWDLCITIFLLKCLDGYTKAWFKDTWHFFVCPVSQMCRCCLTYRSIWTQSPTLRSCRNLWRMTIISKKSSDDWILLSFQPFY